MLIGGEFVTGSDWIESTSPATEELLGRVPAGTAEHVDMAVRAAAAAQPAWAALSVWERGVKLRATAAAIRARADEVKQLEAQDSGNTISNLNGDLYKAANQLEYFAGLATEMKGETVPASAANLHFTLRQPYGVVGRIVPFNHPYMFATANLAAPLTAGNTVIVKSPETSPLSATIMAEIVRETLPAGVVNLLSGFGMPVGDAIARHPQVRRIGFTGSVATGLAIQRAAAETCVKHVSLELGGKNPLIVMPDADVEQAMRIAVAGMNFAWAGQSCGSTSRILVHESLYNRAVEIASALLDAIVVRDPLDPASQMGPLNSRGHHARVLQHVANAHQDGARLVAGGERPAGDSFKRGFWLRPTLFADVTPDMRIARDEVFGPVMAIMPWSDLDTAIRIANDSDYGLTAGIVTNHIGDALRTAKRIESGVVTINGSAMHFVGMPFGGTKDSGIGGEEALEELLSYTHAKSVHIIL
ncbi:aldehyde dehydrogenase family protein [Sphingomonas crocodyli]|uniref:Aldehyde dehydrogenase family protein n=2 Tax=Sphingomonas crocodyli TaxID=1979270 RepID=A0A437M152_9SPHN|nr:aldehyde dehydrogenase family protein [Sphingomonas crocodyli]